MRASGGPGSSILGRLHTRGELKMTQPGRPAPTSAALDYDNTIIGALEMSDKKWVLAVQLPCVKRHTRHVLEASGEELASLIERLKARCAPAGQTTARVILNHEAGRDGFFQALVRNVRTLPVMRREKAQAAPSARLKVMLWRAPVSSAARARSRRRGSCGFSSLFRSCAGCPPA